MFVPAEPLPEAEGPAELVIHAQTTTRPSIYDALGKAEQPRTAQDLDARLAKERAAWDEA